MRNLSLLITVAVLACSALAMGQDPSQITDANPVPNGHTESDGGVDRLIRDLDSTDAKARAQAAHALGKIRKKIDEPILSIGALLTDDDSEVRVAAADALLSFDNPNLPSFFLLAISDLDPRVQFRAAIGLHKLASRHRTMPPNGYSRGEIIVPDWYQKSVASAEKPSVRGLLALACEQRSPDIPEAIPVAMQCLGGGDHDLWSDACSLLFELASYQTLGQCLSDVNVSIRRGSARTVFGSGSRYWDTKRINSILGPLRNGLKDRDSVVRLYCLLSLIGQKNVEPEWYMPLADDTDPTIRCAAIEALAPYKSKVTRDILSRLLGQDPSTRVRVRAAFALAKSSLSEGEQGDRPGDSSAVTPDPKSQVLVAIGIARYSDEEEGKKAEAAIASDLGPAIADLFEAIEDERRRPLPYIRDSSSNDDFDLELIAALGAIGPNAKQAVPRILKDLQTLATLGDGDYRGSGLGGRLQTILYALSKIGPTPELIGGLEHEHRVVRTVSAMALSGHEQFSPRTVPILIDSLNRDCWGVCVYSHTQRMDVACLGQTRHASVPTLIQLLHTTNHAPLAAEALSLMQWDSVKVVPLLLAALADDKVPTHVRLAITDVLGSVGVEHAGAFEVLSRLLVDMREVEAVRVAAAKGLAENRAGDAELQLRKCEEDDSIAVRTAVKEAIRRSAEIRK